MDLQRIVVKLITEALTKRGTFTNELSEFIAPEPTCHLNHLFSHKQ